MEAKAGGVMGTPRGREGRGDPAGTVMSEFWPPESLEHNVCGLSSLVLLLCDGCLKMLTPVPGDLSFYLHQLTQSGRPVAWISQLSRLEKGWRETRTRRTPPLATHTH